MGLIKRFSDKFGLVGGTAVAFQIGHRRSIDFDLFTLVDFNGEKVKSIIRESFKIQSTLVENPGELTLVAGGVRLTFYKYPFGITFSRKFEDIIKMPDLLTLAAMKAHALGRRAKWKDYVDLYFIFKKHSFNEIAKKAEELFKGEFNEKLFREELAYFNDIDYSEKIAYLEGFEVEDDIIKESLKEMSLSR